MHLCTYFFTVASNTIFLTPSSLILIDNLARPCPHYGVSQLTLFLLVCPESSGVFFFRLGTPEVFLLGFHSKATSSSEHQFTSQTLQMGLAQQHYISPFCFVCFGCCCRKGQNNVMFCIQHSLLKPKKKEEPSCTP